MFNTPTWSSFVFYEVRENISRHPLDILRLICKNIVQWKSGLVAHSNPNKQLLSIDCYMSKLAEDIARC